MRMYSLFLTGLLGLLLIGGPVHSAEAQVTRTLTIQDGEVLIDGESVAEDELPANLDVEGVTMQHRFAGVERPIIEIGGQLYALEDDLVAVDDADVRGEGMTIFFERGDAAHGLPAPAETSFEHHQYLEEVQRHSQQLYEQLMREQQMEAETHELARNIRSLPDGEQRAEYEDSLRSTLNDIFELKQENRQREIDQLETQLQELRHDLEQREEFRERMIEQRIQQLVGEEVD